MKKLMAKMRRVRMANWNMLSAGEKVMKVVMKLAKWAAVAAAVVAVFSVVAAVVVAMGVALLMAFVLGDNSLNDRYGRW